MTSKKVTDDRYGGYRRWECWEYFSILCDVGQVGSSISIYLAKFGNTQNRKVKKGFLSTLSYFKQLWQFLAKLLIKRFQLFDDIFQKKRNKRISDGFFFNFCFGKNEENSPPQKKKKTLKFPTH
jgi:hypothetical protein